MNSSEIFVELEKLGFQKERVQSMVASKREEFAGLLTEEAALKIVAREQGVAVKEEEVPVEFLPLGKISVPGERVNAFVRVRSVFAPKEFETEKRKGRVCNISIADDSSSATLVLWNRDVDLVEYGKIQRNFLLEIIGATAKTVSPLELHSSLLTQINAKPESGLEGEKVELAKKIPKNEIPVKKLSEISAQDAEFDAYARVLKVWEEKEFSRADGKKGKVGRMLVSDGTKQLMLVLWDKNADIVRRAKVGDALKIEGGQAKPGREGELELHLGWKGRGVLNPDGHSLAEKEKIWQESYERKLLSELPEGKDCIVSARLAEIYEGKSILKCRDCNATIPKPAPAGGIVQGTESPQTKREELETANAIEEPALARCPSCGSANSRELLILSAELDDGTAAVRTTFFGQTALELLGINTLTVDLNTVLALKKEFLLGENLLLVVEARKSAFSGNLEATARHIISRSPKASDDAEFLKEKISQA